MRNPALLSNFFCALHCTSKMDTSSSTPIYKFSPEEFKEVFYGSDDTEENNTSDLVVYGVENTSSSGIPNFSDSNLNHSAFWVEPADTGIIYEHEPINRYPQFVEPDKKKREKIHKNLSVAEPCLLPSEFDLYSQRFVEYVRSNLPLKVFSKPENWNNDNFFAEYESDLNNNYYFNYVAISNSARKYQFALGKRDDYSDPTNANTHVWHMKYGRNPPKKKNNRDRGWSDAYVKIGNAFMNLDDFHPAHFRAQNSMNKFLDYFYKNDEAALNHYQFIMKMEFSLSTVELHRPLSKALYSRPGSRIVEDFSADSDDDMEGEIIMTQNRLAPSDQQRIHKLKSQGTSLMKNGPAEFGDVITMIHKKLKAIQNLPNLDKSFKNEAFQLIDNFTHHALMCILKKHRDEHTMKAKDKVRKKRLRKTYKTLDNDFLSKSCDSQNDLSV